MRVAVVGSGVSGLAATWLLNEHSEHEVHLYDADSRPGGHANTVEFSPPGRDDAESVAVDTGFIVFNPSTYPNFLRFLKRYPHIKILPTEMTFSVSRDGGLFEWAGKNLMTVFCQPHRVFDPSMWRLIYDVFRFNACSQRLVTENGSDSDRDAELSIGEYLDREGYSQSFRDNYLIPMTACIWSTPPDTCILNFPARTLIQFMYNHHLLQVTGKPKWLTFGGGSREYVNAIMSKLPYGHFHPSSAVTAVNANAETPLLEVCTADGSKTKYDRVIFACHADAVVQILENSSGGTALEKEVLGGFRWSENEAILHCDTRLMPRNRSAWSCWNYLTASHVDEQGVRKPNADQVSLQVSIFVFISVLELNEVLHRTYGMNDLQHISEKRFGPVLVTLNAPFEPDSAKTVGRYRYDHPILDHKAVLTQQRMSLIQGTRGISYAGAFLRYGFHEDGFTSGFRAVAEHIPDVDLPFKIEDPDRVPSGLWAAKMFETYEKSGWRSIHSRVLVIALGFWRTVFRLCGARIEFED